MSALSPSTLEDRIHARASAANISLVPGQTAQLAAYFRLLERWNRTINLTSLPLSPPRGPANDGTWVDRPIDKLIVEPLRAVDEVPDTVGTNWIDLGTGGGSPAVPLKVLRSRWRLTMVEARERKAAFLREVVRTLGLIDTRVLTMRIEAVAGPTDPGSFDLITARAVKFDAGVTACAGTLLKAGGHLVVFGGDISRIINDLTFKKVRERSLFPGAGTLTVFAKTFHVEQ